MQTCEQRAREWVHAYAVGGAALSMVPIPIPGATTIALGAAETYMIFWIAKIYGEELSAKEILAVAGTLELAGLGLKALALEAANAVPIVGWLVKPAIAATAIEGIGYMIVRDFEQKYPGKSYTVDPAVEGSGKKAK